MPNEQVFSALVELYGFRELAERNPHSLQQQVLDFHEVLRTASQLTNFPLKNSTFLLDKCFFKHESPIVLIKFLKKLRSELLLNGTSGEGTLLLRGYVFAEPIEININIDQSADESLVIPGVRLSWKAWELFALADNFKGIGIWIDDSVINYESLDNSERSFLKSQIFSNFFIADPSSHNKLISFPDLRFEENDLGYQATANVIELIRSASYHSSRYCRFFIPLILNWIEHMELRNDPANSNGIGLDHYMVKESSDILDAFKHDADLLASKLISRLYSQSHLLGDGEDQTKGRPQIFPSRRELISKRFVSQTWASRIAENSVTKDILSRSNLGAYFSEARLKRSEESKLRELQAAAQRA